MSFLNDITVKDILAVIGGITIVLAFLDLLFRIIPKFGSLRARFWNYFARKWNYRKLKKRAIASEIENTINEMVSHLQSELPAGWITRASIEWVDRDIKESDLADGEKLLRIKPMESQDINLINGIYFFFARALFPETKEIIPANIRKATALQISRRTIYDKKPFLTQKFEKGLLDSAIREDSSIVEYIDKYGEIDKKGFFTGSFLREIHEIATRSQFKELRNKIEEEIKSVLLHIEEFVNNIHKEYPDSGWFRKGPATSYAFLLVAQPLHGREGLYVKRVKERFQQDVERVYVMGTNQEKHFVKRVISAIARSPECRLLEVFELHRDYRGERNGVGALFVRGGYDKETEEKIESLFEKNQTENASR